MSESAMNQIPGTPNEPEVDKVVGQVLTALGELLESHESCEWKQVGPCVYCVPHQERLYQGTLPEDRRPACAGHDWDYDQGLGFYYICRACGVRDWHE